MLLHANWLSHPTGAPKGPADRYGNPSPYFRKAFPARGAVRRATLTIAALGVYRLYLNGAPVSDEYLSPPWVDYARKIPLLAYDVTDRIAAENAVGVVLGDGWAVGHLGSTATFCRCSYADTVQFAAEILLEYADGTRETVATDASWRCTDGEIRRSDLYMGEVVDHRKSLGDFSAPIYDDRDWATAQVDDFKFSKNIYLTRIDLPPIRVQHTFAPTLVAADGAARIYDVGQNIAGVLRVVLRGAAGAYAVVRHAEVLRDGQLYTENLRKAEATDTFILRGGDAEEFRPLFTSHGFRYASVELHGDVTLCDLRAEAMYTDLPTSGTFSCSSALVNQIYRNVLWSQRDNFYSVPTDCPQRDERLGWLGDAQVFAQSAMYSMDCEKYYAKYLADIRDAQLGNGAIPCVAPLPYVGHRRYTGYDAAAGWSEAVVILPYLHYKMYGNPQIVADNLHAGKMLLRYYAADADGCIRRGPDGRYGDWLNVDDATDLDVIATLFYGHAADLLARLCRIVHDPDEARCRALYREIRAAFRAEFCAPDGRVRSDTQTAYVLAYRFGMLTADEARPQLVRKLAERGGRLSTGFLGIRHLLPALCDLGLRDAAYDILTQTTFPGWGYSIAHGATTIWEHWDSDDIDRLKSMNSFNHYSLGSCVEWMFEYCLGLRPDADAGGLRRVEIRPEIDVSGRIAHASGTYRSPFGEIRLRWAAESDGVRYEAQIPDAIDASFAFPGFSIVHTARTADGTRVFELHAGDQ